MENQFHITLKPNDQTTVMDKAAELSAIDPVSVNDAIYLILESLCGIDRPRKGAKPGNKYAVGNKGNSGRKAAGGSGNDCPA